MKPLDLLDLPTYKVLEQALDKTKLKLHPSQAHGLICGILCGKPSSKAAWSELITGGGIETAEAHEVLQSLYDASSKQLKEFLFDFEMVLPPDSSDLPYVQKH